MSRNFNEVIAEVDGGLLLEQLSQKLADVVRAVEEIEKGGTLNLKISVKPNGKGTVFFDAAVEAKAPNAPISTAVFYADADGNLTRHNPEQEKNLGIRAVS